MFNYDVVIHDTRYSAPVARQVVMTEDETVEIIAMRVLAESTHHRGVEVFQFGARIIGVGSVAHPRRMKTLLDAANLGPLVRSEADPKNA
ncbi:MAG TPA: hypothetical protein VGG68_05265 [Caulobacteraceae bacterium]|jgi:hypothetical protein